MIPNGWTLGCFLLDVPICLFNLDKIGPTNNSFGLQAKSTAITVETPDAPFGDRQTDKDQYSDKSEGGSMPGCEELFSHLVCEQR